MTSTTGSTTPAHWTDDEAKVRGGWYALAVIFPLGGLLAGLYFLIAGTRHRSHVAALIVLAIVVQIAGLVVLASVPV